MFKKILFQVNGEPKTDRLTAGLLYQAQKFQKVKTGFKTTSPPRFADWVSEKEREKACWKETQPDRTNVWEHKKNWNFFQSSGDYFVHPYPTQNWLYKQKQKRPPS